jgi:hypothetical protein
MTALLLILSAESSLVQIDLSQAIHRNSLGPQTVLRNQLLAPVKAVRAIQRAQKDIVGGHLEFAQKKIARALDIVPHFAVAKVIQGAIDLTTEYYAEAAT